jgi:hypothetical protein
VLICVPRLAAQIFRHGVRSAKQSRQLPEMEDLGGSEIGVWGREQGATYAISRTRCTASPSRCFGGVGEGQGVTLLSLQKRMSWTRRRPVLQAAELVGGSGT